MPFSNKPWSDFSESDYSLEQWIRATLIRMTERPKTKGDCKLPVKEPDGTYSRNGIHAAAGALAGARGGVQASAELKRKAAKKLLSLYREMGDPAPDSLYRVAGVKPPSKKKE